MSVYKKAIIRWIIAIIMIIYILNIIIDFSRLFSFYTLFAFIPNELIKRINVLLGAALVWLVGKDCVNPQDNRHMKFVFISICLGEICFLLAKPSIAIGFFTLCQCLLIARHSRGLSRKLITAGSKQKLKLAISALALAYLLFLGIVLLHPLAKLNSPVLMGIVYGFTLSLSLWSGLASYILGLYPYTNSKMIALGMLCFYCCDILVGLDGLLRYSTAWVLASSFIWVFYTPAITLLALSCYSYNAKSYSSATIANI